MRKENFDEKLLSPPFVSRANNAWRSKNYSVALTLYRTAARLYGMHLFEVNINKCKHAIAQEEQERKTFEGSSGSIIPTKPNDSTDVSLIINAHNEGTLANPCAKSISRSVNYARSAGLTIELIIILDNADILTTETFEVFAKSHAKIFEYIKLIRTNYSSLGEARNAGIKRATGEFVITADADDLISENYIFNMHKTCKESKYIDSVFYPEYILSFGAKNVITRYIGLEHYAPGDLMMQNPFSSRLVAQRELLVKFPYKNHQLGSGYSFEDWELTLRLIANNVNLGVAKKAILFYRIRINSLAKEARKTSIFTKASDFHEINFLLSKQYRYDLKHTIAEITKTRHEIHSKNSLFSEEEGRKEFLKEVYNANRIEPLINFYDEENTQMWSPLPQQYSTKNWGWCILDILKRIGGNIYSDIVIIESLDYGGGEKYITNIVDGILEGQSDRKCLILARGNNISIDYEKRLSSQFTVLYLGELYKQQDLENLAIIAGKLIQVLSFNQSKKTRIHLKTCPFAHELLEAHGIALSNFAVLIYYRFSNPLNFLRTQIHIDPYVTSLLQKRFACLSHIIADNEAIIKSDENTVSCTREKYHYLPALLGDLERPINIFSNFEKINIRDKHFRLCWASRIAEEKRPNLPAKIILLCRKFIPNLEIHCYGKGNIELLDRNVGIKYQGEFKHPEDLHLENYDAFIYTSLYDGCPNIILEIISLGCIVIAPNVGSVSDYIEDTKTGYLVENTYDINEDAAQYAAKIKQLYIHWDQTQKIRDSALQKVMKHSAENFRDNISRLKQAVLNN